MDDTMSLTAKIIKREQFRQARQVHGGWWKFFVALLGVKLARLPIPSKRLRASLYRKIFSKKYPPGINEDEAEQPLSAYPTLNALFTRGIKPGFRPIAVDSSQFLCPCDGTVQDIGRIHQDRVLTLKEI